MNQEKKSIFIFHDSTCQKSCNRGNKSLKSSFLRYNYEQRFTSLKRTIKSHYQNYAPQKKLESLWKSHHWQFIISKDFLNLKRYLRAKDKTKNQIYTIIICPIIYAIIVTIITNAHAWSGPNSHVYQGSAEVSIEPPME